MRLLPRTDGSVGAVGRREGGPGAAGMVCPHTALPPTLRPPARTGFLPQLRKASLFVLTSPRSTAMPVGVDSARPPVPFSSLSTLTQRSHPDFDHHLAVTAPQFTPCLELVPEHQTLEPTHPPPGLPYVVSHRPLSLTVPNPMLTLPSTSQQRAARSLRCSGSPENAFFSCTCIHQASGQL